MLEGVVNKTFNKLALILIISADNTIPAIKKRLQSQEIALVPYKCVFIKPNRDFSIAFTIFFQETVSMSHFRLFVHYR